MGIPDEVRMVCQKSSDDSALAHRAEQWVNQPEQACKEIISTVKKILKDKKQPPDCKLRALKVGCRQLHHFCMLNYNIHYLRFSEKKIMKRLTIWAGYKKEVMHMARGADFFGAASANSEAGRNIGIEFLSTLLIYIRTWASLFGMQPGGAQSAFLKSYSQLLNQQVVFPLEQARPLPQVATPVAPSAPRPVQIDHILSNHEIEECLNSEQILRDLLVSPEENEDVMEQLSGVLKQCLPKVEREMGVRLAQPNSERARERLLSLNDAMLSTLSKYESWKQNKGKRPIVGVRKSPPKVSSDDEDLQRAIRESLSIAPPSLHRSGTDVSLLRHEKKDTLHKLELELANLQKEMAEFMHTSEAQKATCLKITADTDLRIAALTRKHTEEQEARKAKIKASTEAQVAQQKLSALQSELDSVQKEVKEKEETLKMVLKAIGAANEESRQLRIKLEADNFAPEVVAPQLSLMQSRPSNAALWPSILQNDKGFLFSDLEVEIRYMIKPLQPFSLHFYIGNKSPSRLENLCTSPVSCLGVTLKVNKERDEAPIESKGCVTKMITIIVSEPFKEVPRLKVSYR